MKIFPRRIAKEGYMQTNSPSRLLLLVVASLFLGLTGDLTHDPVKVVEKYLSLDKRGARLEAISYEVLKPYVAWEQEPVWEQIVVITDYQVSHDISQWTVLNSLEALIPVTFTVIGNMDWGTAMFRPEPRTEEMSVHIQAVKNRWRIVDPIYPPHVGKKRLINFVREALLNETDGQRQEALKQLRHALEKAG